MRGKRERERKIKKEGGEKKREERGRKEEEEEEGEKGRREEEEEEKGGEGEEKGKEEEEKGKEKRRKKKRKRKKRKKKNSTVRSVLVMVATLALSLGIASMVQSQAQNDSGASMPAHSKAQLRGAGATCWPSGARTSRK